LAARWIPTNELELAAAEFREVSWVVVSPSSVGFLAADPHAIRLLRQTADLQLSTHNVFVGGNSPKFTAWATEAWGVNAVCLPNLYNLDETFPHHDRRWHRGAPRPRLFRSNPP